MHPSTEQTLTSLVYSALLDPTCWQMFLDRASADIGGARLQLHGWTTTNGSSFTSTSGYDPDMLSRYHHELAKSNPWSGKITKSKLGLVVPSQELCPEGELKKTIFYNDWIRPQENISVGAGVVVWRSASGPFMFGGNVRESEQENKQPLLIELLKHLSPHVTMAWRLGEKLLESQVRISAVNDNMIDSRYPALILLRTDKTIAFSDATGEALVSAGEECKVDHQGRFSFRHEIAERALAQALQCLVKSTSNVSLRVPLRTDRPAIHLIGLNYDQVREWPLANLLNLPQRCLLCVMYNKAASVKGKNHNIFGLTDAEQQVAVAIARGEGTDYIANQRGVSLATVRSQVQAIYGKCGVNNRAALAALMFSIGLTLAP